MQNRQIIILIIFYFFAGFQNQPIKIEYIFLLCNYTIYKQIMDRKRRQSKALNNTELISAVKTQKIYEKIYQEISISNLTLIKALLNTEDSRIMNPLHQFIKQSQIVCELQNIFNPQYDLTSIKLDQILEGLLKIFQKHYEHKLNSMKQEQKQTYSAILIFNHYLLGLKNNKRLNKPHKILKQDLSFQKLLKVDILSLFVMKDLYYCKKYHCKTPIMSSKFLMSLFNFNANEYEVYNDKFKLHEKQINFTYQVEFDNIINLFFLVQVKFRIFNTYRKFGRIKMIKFKQMAQSQGKKQQSDIIKQQLIDNKVDFRYNLSQIIIVPNKTKEIDDIPHLGQTKILQRLDSIIKMTKEIEIHHQFLKIIIEWNISFKSIQKWYLRAKDNTKLRIKVIQEQQLKINELNICQWYFLKKASTISALQNIIPTISAVSFNQYHNHDPVVIFLCRLVVKRFKLYSTVLIAQRKIERYLLIPAIYACRFQYNFYDFIHSNNQSSSGSNKESSLINTLILLTNGFNIIMAASFQDKLPSRRYWKILDAYYKAKNIKNTNLVAFQLSFDRDYGGVTLSKCIDTFKISHNSNVYISNSPQQFQLHFAVNAFVTSGIATKNPQKPSFHSFIEQQTMKIMVALQSPQINPKNFFNKYTIKEAICQDYDNLHLELKEQQKRLEAISFYRCVFENPRCYQVDQSEQSYWNFQIKQQRNVVKLKSCIFENIKKFKESNQGQERNQKDKQAFIQREQVFAAHFASQLKWRHPYLTREEVDSIREDLQSFMRQHHLKRSIIKPLLEEVAKKLLVFQAYFQDILYESSLNQSRDDLDAGCQKEISFLQKVYQSQNQHIDDTLPSFRSQFYSTYIKREIFPGMKQKLQNDIQAKLSRPFQQQRKKMKMLKVEQRVVQPEYYVFQKNPERQSQQQQQQPENSADNVNGEQKIYYESQQYQRINLIDEKHSVGKINSEGQLCQKPLKFYFDDNDGERSCQSNIFIARMLDRRMASSNFSNEIYPQLHD